MIHRLLLLIAANLLLIAGAEAQDNYFGLSGYVEKCYTTTEYGGNTYERCYDGNLQNAFNRNIADQMEKLEFMKVANDYFLEERHDPYADSVNLVSMTRTMKGVWWQEERSKRLTRYKIKFHDSRNNSPYNQNYIKKECTILLTAEELRGGLSDIWVNKGSVNCKIIDQYEPESYSPF